MVLRKIVGLLTLILVVCSGSLALAGVYDPTNSTAEMATDMELTMFNRPDGLGVAFAQARDIGGDTYDATITLVLRDAGDLPIASFPPEDMWLESRDGGLQACVQGAVADFTTNAAGETAWVNPLAAGGYSTDLCQVVVNGTPLASQTGMSLYFNSPDVNGDLVVDILDITAFQPIFNAGYDRAVDLDYDGVLDILDITRLTTAWLISCN